LRHGQNEGVKEIGEGIGSDQSFEVERDKDVVDLTSWKVENTEYTTLEAFMTDTSENWKEGSEYQEVNYSAETTLAEATIAYMNFFKHEITEKGLNEDFEDLQMLAYNLVRINEGFGYEEQAKRFEDKMNTILSKM
jgi:hypothetical protein